MKAQNTFWLLFFLLFGLNCQQLNPLEPKSLPPRTPKNIFPANDTTDIPVSIIFIWSGSGDSGRSDSITYDFYLTEHNPQPTLLASGLIDTTFRYNSLQYHTHYYWKVVAHNQKGDSCASPVWNFVTRYEHNNPPKKPSHPEPENGESSLLIENSTLSWSGGDPDSFSIVSYDVYFGKNTQSLLLLSESQPDTFFEPGILEFGTSYYWKIVAKDHYGLKTEGPAWNFSTEAAKLLFEDNFDSYPVTGYPETTTWTINKSGANLFITDSIAWNKPGKSVCFVDSAEAGHCYLATRLPLRSSGMIQFYWRISTDKDVFGVRLYSQQPKADKIGPQLSIREGRLQFYDSNYNWQTICQIDSNNWYFIQLLFDCHQKYYKIFVNNELKMDHANWMGHIVTGLDLLYFLTFDNRTCQGAYLDDIKFFSGAGNNK